MTITIVKWKDNKQSINNNEVSNNGNGSEALDQKLSRLAWELSGNIRPETSEALEGSRGEQKGQNEDWSRIMDDNDVRWS